MREPTGNLKEFDFNMLAQFRDELSEFMKVKYNFIIIKKKSIKKEDSIKKVDIIDFFRFSTYEKPYYEKLNSPGDLDELLDNIDELTGYMGNSLDELLEQYENKVEDVTFEAMDMISRLIQKFRKPLKNRGKKINFEDITKVSEMHDKFYEFLRKIVKENLIDRVIPQIYEGMKHGNIEIYSLVLKPINNFLSELGIYTFDIREGQKMNYELCMPMESDKNGTIDYTLEEVVKEVVQLPYVFTENSLVSEGKNILWRVLK